MIAIKSFYGETTSSNQAAKVAIEDATEQSNKWISKLRNQFGQVAITHMTSAFHCDNDGFFYKYVVTIAVTCD